ncbi:hypothetical protein HMPREF9062_0253 [Actinomyces sp. oral taxon 448 str. F0400]|nr:hypothetical protein HMPREF9062_0253 [Actinomyces sp. oral taxon 448 str. F0400]
MGSAISTLYAVIDDLNYRRQQILDLNSNGLTTTNADGTVNYCLPDGISDTADNIETYNFEVAATARADADALTQATTSNDGKTDDGRTIDDIMASMTDNQGNPVYANAVITEIGPENLTSLPINAYRQLSSNYPDVKGQKAEDLASQLGTMLASASSIWNEEKSQEIADAISGSVDEENEYPRISALNAILGGHDDNGDGVSDLNFNDTFLVDLANKLDDIDATAATQADTFTIPVDLVSWFQYETFTKGKDTNLTLPGHSHDPMTGVLDAMGGNPGAALGYLAPAGGDGSVDTSRIDDLSARDWGREGLSGFTAALAAGSSLRASEDDDQAARATSLAGHGIHDLAQNTDAKNYTDDTKSHIGVLLANCPNEVTAAWGQDIHGTDAENPDALIDRDGTQLGTATTGDLDTLAYRVADCANATGSIAAGIAAHASDRSASGVAFNEGSPDLQLSSISGVYSDGAQAVSHLVGIADSRAKDKTIKDIDETKELNGNAKTVISAFTTAAAGGLSALPPPAGTLAAAATATGGTLLAPVAADALVDDPQAASSPVSLTLTDGMRAAAVQDAAQAGLINQDSYQVGPTTDPDKSDVPTAADRYNWIVDDGQGGYTIDLSGTPAGGMSSVSTWVSQVTDESRKDSVPPDASLSTINESIKNATGQGYASGSSSTVPHSGGGGSSSGGGDDDG